MSFNYAHVLNSLRRGGAPASTGGTPASAGAAAPAGTAAPAAPPPPPRPVPAPEPGPGGRLPGEGYLTPSGDGSSASPARARSPRSPQLSPRARRSSPVLLHPLPGCTTLEKESRAQSELELDRQTAQRRREAALAEALLDAEHRVERIAAKESVGTWRKKSVKEQEPGGDWGSSAPFATPPQAYELYAAIDKRDIDYIARVRDHAFNLLLQKNAGEFPVIYAARWGDTHREVLIVIVGALSRYVNQLSEDDFKTRDVQNTLKMLRANLKLAIDNALLPAQHSALLASYLQVLIMSEGDAWVHRSTHDLGLVLRSDGSSPVQEAESMVRRFCTKELRGAPQGDVEVYVANAALDLVIMAAWGVAAGQMDAEPLPTYTLARDLRTYMLFVEAMDEHRKQLHKVSRRVRAILGHLEAFAGDTKKGVQERLRDVRAAVDGK